MARASRRVLLWRTEQLYRRLEAMRKIGMIDRVVAYAATFNLDRPYTPTFVVQSRGGKIAIYEVDRRKQKQLQTVAGVFHAIECYMFNYSEKYGWECRRVEGRRK